MRTLNNLKANDRISSDRNAGIRNTCKLESKTTGTMDAIRTSSFLVVILAAQWSSAVDGVITEECQVEGKKSAQIVIQQFTDFECSYCAKGAHTMRQLAKEFPDKIKVVYRNLPLPFHKHSALAARATTAVCLYKPHLLNAFHNGIFENQDRFVNEGEKFILELADKIGYDSRKLLDDMDRPSVMEQIKNDRELAEQHKFKGTPSFIIGDEDVVGAYPIEHFRDIINRKLDHDKNLHHDKAQKHINHL